MKLHQTNEFGLQWNLAGAGLFSLCGRTVATLPAGAYTCLVDPCGNPVFQARELLLDELIEFPNSLPDRVMDEIERFWETGERFRRLGFLHRRGYLFHGKQGCGKSSLIHQIIARVVAADQLAFFCQQPCAFVQAVTKFRQVESDRPIVCVFEDIDAIIAQYGDSELLQWLDGNAQVDTAINLASTNYPERLDPRIVSRPRRFDRVLKIEAPDARIREAYFARKLPELSRGELYRWVELSHGLPFAALAEMVIGVWCLGNDLDETTALLHRLDAQLLAAEEYAEQE